MDEYEIRVLNSNGTCSAIIEQIQLNDHAAIRSAQKMARGQQFEVWRGLDCIYAGSIAVPAPDPTIRDRPAA
jgi:hypothetical protein